MAPTQLQPRRLKQSGAFNGASCPANSCSASACKPYFVVVALLLLRSKRLEAVLRRHAELKQQADGESGQLDTLEAKVCVALCKMQALQQGLGAATCWCH